MATSSTRWIPIERGDDHPDVDETRLPYQYLGTLGRGSCSIVDKVMDLSTGAVFARKVFIVRRSNRRYMNETFENELRNIRQLEEHHHMIRVFATYTTTKLLSIILDPVADCDLDEYLGELQSLQQQPSENSVEIAQMTNVLKLSFGCLAAGLAFMHPTKIRHKDIKPGNILIYNNRVLYTDFGISFNSDLFENSTTEGPTELTRKWAAPEVLARNPRNSSSDVYSLGCVFIKVFAILNRSFAYREPGRFNDEMDNIHTQLIHNPACGADMNFLPSIMAWMTQRDPSTRWTAQRAWQECVQHTAFRCEKCARFQPTANSRPLLANSRWRIVAGQLGNLRRTTEADYT